MDHKHIFRMDSWVTDRCSCGEVRKLEHKRCVNVKERCGYRLDDKNCYALTRFSLYVFGMSLKTEK